LQPWISVATLRAIFYFRQLIRGFFQPRAAAPVGHKLPMLAVFFGQRSSKARGLASIGQGMVRAGE
jgi:hypothetical protein